MRKKYPAAYLTGVAIRLILITVGFYYAPMPTLLFVVAGLYLDAEWKTYEAWKAKPPSIIVKVDTREVARSAGYWVGEGPRT